MTAAVAAYDLRTLRLSRVAVLNDLCERASEAIAGMKGGLEGLRGKAILTHTNRFVRLCRWLRVAIWLTWAVLRGDWDVPRQVIARRRALQADAERPERADPFERFDGPEPAERFSHFLRRPFGEVVAMICKGIGLTPDWDAWVPEPWAQEEVRTRPPTSPYAAWPEPSPPRSEEHTS